jgi:hypothetical protein
MSSLSNISQIIKPFFYQDAMIMSNMEILSQLPNGEGMTTMMVMMMMMLTMTMTVTMMIIVVIRLIYHIL